MKQRKIYLIIYMSLFSFIINLTQPLFVHAAEVREITNETELDVESEDEEDTIEESESVSGWIEIDDNYYYFYENEKVTGEIEIEEIVYYFNEEGILIGFWMNQDNQVQFKYANGKNAADEWLKISDKLYYLNAEGHVTTNWKNINNKWYYFNDDGIMVTGWQDINNKWYYLKDSGEMIAKNYQIKGKSHIFSSSGVWQGNWEKNKTGWWFKNTDKTYPKNQWKKINNEWYYFNNRGYMSTGWQKINNKWYYLKRSGAMINENTTINGKSHLISKNGVWQGNWEKNKTGWWFKNPDKTYPKNQWKKINNKWYYFNNRGYMQTGWQKIKNKWYYLYSNGSMQTGWKKVKSKWYYLNSSGVMQTGWNKIKNKWYYLNSSGVMQTGWSKVKNKWYYMNSSGSMQTGWIKLGNKEYYLESSGVMVTGSKQINGKSYIFNTSGHWQGNWEKNKTGWWFKNTDGSYPTNQWKQLNNKWYYFDNKGYMTTGWKKIKNKWYYMNNSGSMQTGWKKINNKWYYMYSSGAMASNTVINGYFVGKNGVWVKNDDTILSGKTIMLDPGHGGNWPTGDPGAVNNALGIKEKDLNNDLTREIAKVLKSYGAKVIYTRTPEQESNPSLQKRAEIANKANPDLFLSVHHDSSTNKSTTGISTHWSSYRPGLDTKGTYVRYNGKNYPFVKEVKNWSGVTSGLSFKMNGKVVTKNINDVTAYNATPTNIAKRSKEFSDLLFDSVYSLGFSETSYKKDRNLYVTRWVNSPAVLLEAGFLTNTMEVNRIRNPKFRAQIADKVGEAVIKFFEK